MMRSGETCACCTEVAVAMCVVPHLSGNGDFVCWYLREVWGFQRSLSVSRFTWTENGISLGNVFADFIHPICHNRRIEARSQPEPGAASGKIPGSSLAR